MADTSRPNVLLVLTDDQRFDTLGAVNNPHLDTPNLDRLIARGSCFTHAHIMGGSSPAVCMPSRAMLHTGRSLYHITDQGQSIADQHVMLGEHLRAAGYTSFGCGKWHNGTDAFNRSFDSGREIFFGGMADHWNVPCFGYDPTGRYAGRIPECVDPWSTNELRHKAADHITPGLHSTDMLGDAAVEQIERYARRDPADAPPWFMYVAFLAPHDPRTMPEQFRDMYSPHDIDLPASYMPAHPFDNGELVIRDEQLEAWPRTESAVRRHIAEYYAMISHLDFQMGRVLDALEASGQVDHTLIVFAGDNGLAVGRHGLMGKQSLYDHSVRVPLVMAGPGVPEGQRFNALCYLHDIYPTVCDLAALETPPSVEGRSLAPVLRGEQAGVRDVLHLAYRHLHRGVRDPRYKLIEINVEGRRRTQLFDLVEDPDELHDRSDEPAQAPTIGRLRNELLGWRDRMDDTQEGQGATFWAEWDEPRAPGP